MKVKLKPHPSPQHGSTLPRNAVQTATLAQALPSPGRSVAVVEDPMPPQSVKGSGRNFIESPLKKMLIGLNARAITPRAMQALSQDLYANGVLTWEEHAELAFQAELHPDYPRTIGALTGEKPFPDLPKDYVKVWEKRLDYERRHFPESQDRERALHILSVLRRIESPTDVNA